MFGAGLGQKRGYCGHQEIELALLRLAKATKQEEYREFARWMIEERGKNPSPFLLELDYPVVSGSFPPCSLGIPMAILDYAGYAAAVCTTGAYVPQVLRVWRTRSTHDISLKMFLVLVTGLALWLTYGIWRSEIPLIAANGVTLMLASTILYFKLKHG